MDLKTYLSGLSADERETFATKCQTSVGHLKNVSYGYRQCAEGLAIEIERHSGRKVVCETLRPDVDWGFLRDTKRPTKRQRMAANG
jgi:DNA-binding transcriptional regulator YdaS (Cro superfamily)